MGPYPSLHVDVMQKGVLGRVLDRKQEMLWGEYSVCSQILSVSSTNGVRRGRPSGLPNPALPDPPVKHGYCGGGQGGNQVRKVLHGESGVLGRVSVLSQTR